MEFKTYKLLVILGSILFPILIFLAWFTLGIIFNETKTGILAGIGFGLFYGLRILYSWIKPL